MRGASRWSHNPDSEQEEEEEEKRVGGLAVVAAARTTNPVSRGKTAARTTRPTSPRSRRRCSAAVVYPVWERRLGALWDAADIVQKGKDLPGARKASLVVRQLNSQLRQIQKLDRGATEEPKASR